MLGGFDGELGSGKKGECQEHDDKCKHGENRVSTVGSRIETRDCEDSTRKRCELDGEKGPDRYSARHPGSERRVHADHKQQCEERSAV